jgi:hypothetical protein
MFYTYNVIAAVGSTLFLTTDFDVMTRASLTLTRAECLTLTMTRAEL